MGDTENNVTEFDEEDKLVKVDNFIKLLYNHIPTATQDMLFKKSQSVDKKITDSHRISSSEELSSECEEEKE